MSAYNEYDDYCDRIEAIFKNCDDRECLKYKHKVLDEMKRRTKEVAGRGLRDNKVVHELIKDEFNEKYVLDGYREYVAVEKEKKTARRIPIATAIIMLSCVAVFLFIGFAFSVWHPTWIIIVIGAIASAINSMLFGVSLLDRRKKLYFVMRALVAGSVMVLAVPVFLILRIGYGIEKAYLVFLVMLAVMFIGDLILATATRQRLFIINYFVTIPVLAVFLYVILGILGIVSWSYGWLLIILSLAVDLMILWGFIRHNRKYSYKPEVQDEW